MSSLETPRPSILAPLESILLRSTSIYPCIYPWVCLCIHPGGIHGLIYGYIHGLSVDVSMVISHSDMDDAYTDVIVHVIVVGVAYVGKSLGKMEGAGFLF